MSDYIEPTQADFDNSEQAAMDLLATTYPKLLTKPGAALRELLVRPLAYVYSWLDVNTANRLNTATMAYLRNSQATENATADALASNYFVTRQEGSRSRGMITLVLQTSSVQIAAGSAFTVEGIRLVTERKIIAMGSEYTIISNIQYVPVIPYNTEEGTYVATIPVVAEDVGAVEIAPGGNVVMEFANAVIVDAMLTSPVSGGKDTETDAELMTRAEYNTANAGIGSYYGISKKISSSPIRVRSMNIIAGEDLPLYRARRNSTGINPGGYVDCHVKTYDQYALDTIVMSVTQETATVEHTIHIHDIAHAGLLAVCGVRVNGQSITDYSVEFGSTQDAMDARGARLSPYQDTLVSFSTASAVSSMEIGVDVAYMPGIYDIQTYMDSSSNRFIGQSLIIKAAVPIAVTLACKVYCVNGITNELADGIKSCIASCVNGMPVGTVQLNFSDLQKAVHTTYPDVDLRIPCSMTGRLFLRDGTVTGLYSTSGVLDAGYPVSETEWDPAICYFSLITDDIRLESI